MDSNRVLRELFKVKVSKDKLTAQIWYNEGNNMGKQKWSEKEIIHFLKLHKITFGLIPSNIKQLAESMHETLFPLTIAQGSPAENGIDGEIRYSYDTSTEVDRSKGYDFKEVMRIPAVQEGEKIATLIPPTKGKNGRSVYGTEIKAQPGKPLKMRAGKNVTMDQEKHIFYATVEGQVSVHHRAIHVHHVYEVAGDISLKTGNIDFLGNVVIRGNVPTGFSIKATGDIKIFGLVEGAELTAGGSVLITEGMVGIRQGIIQAEENVHIGYINQGKVKAGASIYVDNSILHSNCTAIKTIYCKEGNIIGGVLSAGQSIAAKDVGNRMNTITELSFGMNKEPYDRQLAFQKERETLVDNLRKLDILKKKLSSKEKLDAKSRITLLKLRKSFEHTNEKIKEIDAEIETMNATLGMTDQSFLTVNGTIYPNTTVSFGKYRRTIDKRHNNVTIRMKNNEISVN